MSRLPSALALEHLEVISRLALFRDHVLGGAAEHVMRAAMNEIHDTLVTHFRVEQNTMQVLRYGGLWRHTDEHFVIWHSMLRHMDACERHGFLPTAGHDLYESMMRLLERHSLDFDKDFLMFAALHLPKR